MWCENILTNQKKSKFGKARYNEKQRCNRPLNFINTGERSKSYSNSIT